MDVSGGCLLIVFSEFPKIESFQRKTALLMRGWVVVCGSSRRSWKTLQACKFSWDAAIILISCVSSRERRLKKTPIAEFVITKPQSFKLSYWQSFRNEIGTKTKTPKKISRKSLKTRFVFFSITRSVDFERHETFLPFCFCSRKPEGLLLL